MATPGKKKEGGGSKNLAEGWINGARPVIMLPSNMAVINEMLTLDESAVFHCDQHDISILWLLPLWLIRWRAAALIPVIRMSLSRQMTPLVHTLLIMFRADIVALLAGYSNNVVASICAPNQHGKTSSS